MLLGCKQQSSERVPECTLLATIGQALRFKRALSQRSMFMLTCKRRKQLQVLQAVHGNSVQDSQVMRWRAFFWLSDARPGDEAQHI